MRCCGCSSSTSGEERFREGVSHYLSLHQYANTETNDLWDAIEEKSGEPVRRMMDSWIWQPGYPLVGASLDGDDLVLRPATLRLRRRRPRRPARPRRGSCRSASASVTRSRQCCSTTMPTWRGSRSPPPATPSSSTPAATASIASPTTRSCAGGSRGSCSGRSTPSSATTSSTTRGTSRRRRPAGRGGLPHLRRGLRRRARPRCLAGHRARAARPRPARRRQSLPGAAAPCAWPARSPVVAELGDPVAGEDDLTRQAARPAHRHAGRPGRRRRHPGPLLPQLYRAG